MGYQTDPGSNHRYGETAGSANAYTLSLVPPIYQYAQGLRIDTLFHTDNTGAVTINVDSLGEVYVRKVVGGTLTELETDDLNPVQIYSLIFDGSGFQLVLPGRAPIPDASQSEAGVVFLASQAEIDSGTNASKAVTPSTLSSRLRGIDKRLYADTLSTAIGAGTGEQTIGTTYLLPMGVLRQEAELDIRIGGILQACSKTLRVWLAGEALVNSPVSEGGEFSVHIRAMRQGPDLLKGLAILVVNDRNPIVQRFQLTPVDLDTTDHLIRFTGQNTGSAPGSIAREIFLIRLIA